MYKAKESKNWKKISTKVKEIDFNVLKKRFK